MLCLARNDLSVTDAKAVWAEVLRHLGATTKRRLAETLVCGATRADTALLTSQLVQPGSASPPCHPPAAGLYTWCPALSPQAV
jgi:hypothetical protein